jgi:hypothetical protein
LNWQRHNTGYQFQNRQQQSFWLSISKSVATVFLPISELATRKFLAADFRIGSGTIFGCRFLNQ